MTEANTITQLAQSGNFAALVLDRMELLLPQSDLYGLEPAADMIPALGDSVSIGQFQQGDRSWPCYALSADLAPLPQKPVDCRVAALIKHDQGAYGVLCKQVYMIEAGRLELRSIPEALRTRSSPLLALALFDGKVLCVSSAKVLSSRLRSSPQGAALS